MTAKITTIGAELVDSIHEKASYWTERLDKDEWFPANAGTEKPFTTKTGKRMLYCYNPVRGKHAYINLDTDVIVPDYDLYLYGLV